ncbi:MAG: diacylglycerol kinase family lipid kinase [Paludibacteraceae bacterium]|nr:diacylglycerol kinase family lipid kinase [Paludibacteraceae bacterium]
MPKRIAFIINPISGTSDKKDLPDLIKQTFTEGWDVTIAETQHAGHGKEMASQFAADGYDVVVACGGDGTMNEVASALVHTDTAFAIVPYGSGNGFARHLGYSMRPKEALEQILNGEERSVDSGLANGKRFFCTCGTGFDAHVSHSFSKEGKRGFLTYLKVILREYKTYEPRVYQLESSSFPSVKKKAFLVTFANAAQWGNKAYIAPHASVCDGVMDICVLGKFPVYSALGLAMRLFLGSFDKSRHVTALKAKEVTLIRDMEGEFHIDGDPLMMGKEIKVEIDPLSLKVRVKPI